MKFLGEVKDSKLKEIRKSLASVMLGFMPFDITFMDVGYFTFEKNPRVLWVGADSLEIIKLAKKIDESMNIIGFEREKREFQSHITIARIKEGYYDINTIEKDIYFGKMTINKIGLYQSHLSSKGPTYQIINTFLAQ